MTASVARSQTFTVPSPHDDARRRPSGLKRMLVNSAREGKTPAFHDQQVRDLIDSVIEGDVIRVRDKTLLIILAYTAARAGAVARLRTMDYVTDGRSWFFNFGEKGGKLHQVPCGTTSSSRSSNGSPCNDRTPTGSVHAIHPPARRPAPLGYVPSHSADDQHFTSRFDDLACHRLEPVEQEDSPDLSQQPIEEPEIPARDPHDRSDRLLIGDPFPRQRHARSPTFTHQASGVRRAQGPVGVDEPHPRVELRVARQSSLQPRHANQDQPDAVPVRDVPQLLQARHSQAVGLIRQQQGRQVGRLAAPPAVFEVQLLDPVDRGFTAGA